MNKPVNNTVQAGQLNHVQAGQLNHVHAFLRASRVYQANLKKTFWVPDGKQTRNLLITSNQAVTGSIPIRDSEVFLRL